MTTSPPVSPPRPDPYWPQVLAATPRLLGTMDREPLSPTFGSFDRDHWAWKFRDQPINMLQASLLPLAWLWRSERSDNPWGGSSRLLAWLEAAMEAVLARQHSNGAFDTVGPYTQDHGVTLAMAYTLETSRRSLDGALTSALERRLREACARAAAFATRSAEDYAFISNHQALFALAWHRVGTLLGNHEFVERGRATIDAILERQSRDGWFLEYGGPDPGYESLGLHYLALYQAETQHTELRGAMERAAEFHAWMLQPDGGIGAGYGSRHTVQWYPAGFELMASWSPRAAGTSRFMRAGLERGSVVTPATVDGHNLPILLHSYCLASEALRESSAAAAGVGPPCLDQVAAAQLRVFEDSGIVVARSPRFHAIAALRRGGTLSVFTTEASELAWEDAGYVATVEGDAQGLWASSMLGMTRKATVAGNQASSESDFGKARLEVLTPFKFLILRLLNLTAFRSVTLGVLIRRMIIARLVTGRERGPLQLERLVRFSDQRIEIEDRIRADRGVLRLWRPRSFGGVHMGSARYYHPRDLAATPELDVDGVASRLAGGGIVTLLTTVEWGDEGVKAIVLPQ